jgi:hypothetical protein
MPKPEGARYDMPRHTRTKLMRRMEAYERKLREDALLTLGPILRREWRERCTPLVDDLAPRDVAGAPDNHSERL